jgi:hypothetical protein
MTGRTDIRDVPELDRAFREIEEQHPEWSPERVAQEFANRLNNDRELSDALLQVVLKEFMKQHPSVEDH